MLVLIEKIGTRLVNDDNQLIDLKKGYFTELELEQTKEMIRRSLLLSQDNQSSLIERAIKMPYLENLQQTLKVGLQNSSKLTKRLFVEQLIM